MLPSGLTATCRLALASQTTYIHIHECILEFIPIINGHIYHIYMVLVYKDKKQVFYIHNT